MKLSSLIKNVILEQEEEVRITPEQYKDNLKAVAGRAYGILKLPKFKGKQLVVVGNLNLSGDKRITRLGPIKIEGNLDVTHTNIETLRDVVITGRPRYWGTPWEQTLERQKRQQQIAEAEERRKEDVWNLANTDEEGEKAHAAFNYAVQEGLLKALDDDDKERVSELRIGIKDLEDQQERLEVDDDESYSDRYDEIQDQIDELEEELDDLEGNYTDVYDLIPYGGHYGFTTFMSISERFEISVGTESEADEALEDYYQEWIDNPKEYIRKETLEWHIDGDAVADDFRDTVEEWIRESPESYGIDRELSDDQEEEIWLLEMEKWVYENEGIRAPISEPTIEENGKVFDFVDAEDNRFQYRNQSNDPNRSEWVLYMDGNVVSVADIYEDEDTEEHETERENRISDIEYEIDEIKENPDGDLDENKIEEEVEDRLYDIRRDPSDFLIGVLGYDDSILLNYIDKDSLLKSLVNDGSYGDINGYDGNYDTTTVNGNYYIVMRTN